MPLATPILQSALEALFAEPPLLVAECAEAWAQAMADYAAGVVPVSTTVSAAATSLSTALAGAFAKPVAAPDVDAAFGVFSASVAAGMLPLFTGAPPPAPLGIATLLAASQPTHAAAAAAFATHIHQWMVTGSAVLVLTPFTAVPAWS
jgi:hypothetical protein